jgi:hypothetical protein
MDFKEQEGSHLNQSKERVLALLKKDLYQYYILIFLFPILSIAMFYLPGIFINNEYKLGIVSQQSFQVSDMDLEKYKFFLSKQDAIKELKEGKIHGVVDVIHKTVDMSDKKTVPSKEIQKAINLATGKSPLQDGKDSEEKNYSISSLIGSLLLTISCFIAGPIIFLGEKTTKTYNAILLTPLTFNEYILSKTAICALINMASLVLLFIVTNLKHLSLALILFLLIASIFMSIISGIISSLFSNLDKAMIFISPVMIFLIVLDFYIWLEKIKPVISIQTGLKFAMEFRRLDWLSGASIVLSGILAFFILKRLCRKSSTWTINL